MIESMPGQYHQSIESVAAEAGALEDLGVPAVLLFGLPSTKDEMGSAAADPDGVIQKAVRAIKSLLVITDLCLCEYTSHGHCGLVRGERVLNDETLPLLGEVAVSQAQAGADIVAPSGMMDHMVRAIRTSLDWEGFADTPILSYSAKYASTFYGPFREAAQSGFAFGDRRGYQMDPANFAEALWEVQLDIEEGADMVMVKPAMPYLDVLRAESLMCIKRAGADMIITYWAKEYARQCEG